MAQTNNTVLNNTAANGIGPNGRGPVHTPGRPAPSQISTLIQSLDSLTPGQSARVSHIDTPIGILKNRLLALGLVNNTPLYVKNIAPLGDPMSIEVRGFCLSMRKDEARAIKVFIED